MSAPFAPDAPRIWSIPPGANFLDELARVLADATDLPANPMALADALIYVPNRRSVQALAFALHKASGRGACLLPDIRALGDLETDEPPPSVEAALADLPPALPDARRIGELTRLVLQFYHARGLTIGPPSALSAARELARLLDQAALSGVVDWDSLDTIVADRQLAKHWQQSLDFLKIITEQWPVQLAEAAAMDPYARRFAAAEAMAAQWISTPPKTPVIITGSTGATPASRLLMQAATALPQGLVVLPGLDHDGPANVWDRLAKTPSHPQFTLARTLEALDLTPASVAQWPETSAAPGQTARRRLIHEALAPAENTANWSERLNAIAGDGDAATFVRSALSGLTLIETADDTDEAMTAALLLRQSLETETQTAALVTPDAGLARHVSALLRHWDIHVAPSSGLPLLQTRAGSFAQLVIDWLGDLSHPVALMAVLRHPSCRFDPGLIDTLDRFFLRGPRVWQTLAELRCHIETAAEPERRKYSAYDTPDITAALSLLDQIEAALVSANAGTSGDEPVSGADWLSSAAALMGEIATTPAPWSGEDGANLSKTLSGLADITAALGPQPPEIFSDLFKAEATRTTVQTGPSHARLAIWGPLEARLQTADKLILAGLNEGIWPAQPPADAFLPRLFRRSIGLSDPDERIGLSAHDFAQLATAPDVTLLTARRRDDKPVVASRWIWRLRTLARGALGKDAAEQALAPGPGCNPLDWIKHLQQAPPLPAGFTACPRPTPARADRPPALSVTRIEALVRDPYAIYCQYVLGLHRLDPLNLPGDVRLRGTAIHRALELFEEDGQEHSVEALVTLLEEQLRKGGESKAELIALREKRREVAAEYIAWRADNAHQVEGKPVLEQRGEITLSIAGQDFKLSGTADRIEKRTGNTVAILDFKSGKPPTEPQVRTGLSPQMPLQGLIAQKGGYKQLSNSVSVSALTYIRFGTQFGVREIGEKAGRGASALDPKPVPDIIAEAETGLIALLTAFADPEHPYLSAPRPERVAYWSDYTRLARRTEWAGLDIYD